MEGNVKVRGGVGVERLRREHGLLVFRKLKLLKQDKTEDAELADIERRCLFTKYAICRTNINEDAAGALLQRELDHYTNIVDDRARLNNYWGQFDSLGVSTDNNPLDWKANLKELGGGDAVPFLKALPCCDDNTTGCTRAQYTNKDVEKMVDLWRIGATSPGTRKTPVMPAKAFAHRNKEESQRRRVFLEQSTANEGPTIGKQSIALNKNVQCPVGEKREGQSDNKKKLLSFKSARELAQQTSVPSRPLGVKKSLGGRALNSPFVCPFKEEQPKIGKKMPDVVDERLKNIEPKMIELIKNEIMFGGSPISWDDIAGLEHVKKIIKEIVVFPMLRPDIFTGLRRPPKGILLFGPPGTGKTLIGKCIASQSKSTFFSISASSLTSKWIGEGEKMVRALFAVARVEQPSVVFIDEIDSLLCQRSETEHESSRRMKTEFLVQLDGAATGDEDRILVIGATNRPYELDEAARRRLVKRLYIPLPELTARTQIICNLLKTERNGLTDNEINEIAKLTDGYSGADMTNLCKEASMGPIRNIPFNQLENINKEDLREVTFLDFKVALDAVRPSVSPRDLSVYLDWDCTYGTACAQLH